MDPLPIAKMAATALWAALTCMLAALLLRGRWMPWRPTLMPVALAIGLLAGYLTLMDLPHATADQPWYEDEARKMAIVVAVVAGLILAIAGALPKALSFLVWAALIAGATWLTVRRSWDGWGWYAGGLAVAMLLYFLSLVRVVRQERLFLVGSLVMWASAAASALVVMAWVDQSLGRMLIMLAVLAGLAAVAGILKFWRAMATEAAPFLAVVYAVVLMLAAFYNPAPLPLSAFVLLGCGPLGAAVAWIPALRKRPWLCVLAALATSAALVVTGALIAARNAPALE